MPWTHFLRVFWASSPHMLNIGVNIHYAIVLGKKWKQRVMTHHNFITLISIPIANGETFLLIHLIAAGDIVWAMLGLMLQIQNLRFDLSLKEITVQFSSQTGWILYAAETLLHLNSPAVLEMCRYGAEHKGAWIQAIFKRTNNNSVGNCPRTWPKYIN